MGEPGDGRGAGTIPHGTPPGDALRAVAQAWLGPRAMVFEPIDADAFSGATLVRVRADGPAGDLVLKSFPAEARSRILRVHRLVAHLRAAGAAEIPEVIATPSGDTLVADDSGGLWEAVRFVRGVTAAAPEPARARAAAATLARLHGLAATWPEEPPRIGVAPAVVRRIEHARRMVAAPWGSIDGPRAAEGQLAATVAPRLVAAVAVARRPEFAAVLRRIATLRPAEVPLQAVFRDVWSGHVLYAADGPPRVAGIVDVHAAAVDTPATDVARLLGSWSGQRGIPLSDTCAEPLAAYAAVRPLAPRERLLVPWLDATGTLFALDNWFRWVLVEGRRFERPVTVLERVDRLLAKLEAAVEWLGRSGEAV